MMQTELIKHYENNFKKVKAMHNPSNHSSELMKDKCNAYIEFAEKELEAVKNGRTW